MKLKKGEIFVDIKGWEGSYMVSNFGRVRSLPKKHNSGNASRDFILKDTEGDENKTIYVRCTLDHNGKHKRYSVHRLVAEAFIPNLDNKPQVNHIDSNPYNNHASNLEWVTGSENMLHCVKQGRGTYQQAADASGRATLKRAKERGASMVGKIFCDVEVIKVTKKLYKNYSGKYKCLLCDKVVETKRMDRVFAGDIPCCAKCRHLRRKYDI